jgi:transposase
MRLRFELHLSHQQIGRSCAIGASTAHKYLKRIEAAGLNWPLPEDWDEARLEAAVFARPGAPVRAPKAVRSQPDFESIHEQLRRHRHLTLQLLWEEYREGNPEGYRYSRFCELYQRWRSKLDLVLRQEHKAGEKMFIDWAGASIPVYDRITGESSPAPFVATLGASSYTFAEAMRDQQMESWLTAHVHAFECCQGIPALAVFDFVPGHKIRLLWRVALCGHWRARPRTNGLGGRLPAHNGWASAHHGFLFGISERRLSCSRAISSSRQRSTASEEVG